VGVVETSPFSCACHPINLVRSCGSRWKMHYWWLVTWLDLMNIGTGAAPSKTEALYFQRLSTAQATLLWCRYLEVRRSRLSGESCRLHRFYDGIQVPWFTHPSFSNLRSRHL
jgi:hypothetical protein